MEKVSDDLMSPEVIHDPHSYYHGLREADPVHWNDRWGGWVVTRYEDAIKVLRNADAFSADRMGFLERELAEEDRETITPIFDVLSSWMVFTDPPLHTQLRSLVNRQFTPKEVERYREQVRAIVNDALDEVEEKGEMEVIRDFAYKVPMTVILDLMGVPDLNREKIKEWSEELGLFFFIRADEPRRRHFATRGVSALAGYMRHVVEEKANNRGDDLISLFLGAEDAGVITRDDVIANCVLLAFGGHETTMNLIANGTLALIRHPDQWLRIKEDPTMIRSAIEELLRYDGSVKTTVRWAKEDVEVGNEIIKAGQRVLIGLSAANRDPEMYENPDALDVARDPNPHMAFGQGIHVCVGAPLARLEAQEAFAALTQRFDVPEIVSEDYQYWPTVIGRSLKSLNVKFG
jgi:cytochrome P450